jgi:hypothetical protein
VGEAAKGTIRDFVDFLNTKGSRKKTRHDEIFRWEDAIQAVVGNGSYATLDSDTKADLHLKSSMLKRAVALAERRGDLSDDFCAWLSAALEGTNERELRSGLLEVRVANVLMDVSTSFRVLDVPGKKSSEKKTDFALGRTASIECKRLIGNPLSGRNRVEDADAQHAATRASLDATSHAVTVLCLAQVDTLEDFDPNLVHEVCAKVDGALQTLDNTDAVILAVESWRRTGDVYESDFDMALLLKPGRSIEDSIPNELHGWFPEVVKRRE